MGAALVGSVVGLAAAAAPASAHSQVESITPAPNSTSTAVVTALKMQFNEGVRLKYSTIGVTGPDGDAYQRGAFTELDALVTQRLYPTRSGTYTVVWRVISADGHPVGGTFRFKVALAAGTASPDRPPAPSPAASATSGHGEAWWLAAAVGMVAVLIGGMTILGRRRVRS